MPVVFQSQQVLVFSCDNNLATGMILQAAPRRATDILQFYDAGSLIIHTDGINYFYCGENLLFSWEMWADVSREIIS